MARKLESIESRVPSPQHQLADTIPFGAQLLIDRRLGDRDALEIVQQLSTNRPDVRVTVMSAFVDESDRIAAREAGASTVFEKPMDLDGWRRQLLAVVVAGATHQRAA